MATDGMYETTAERLQKYGVFSALTVKDIALFAEKQAGYKTYKQFFEAVGIPEVKLFVNKKGEGVPVVDIASIHAQKGVLVIHLPMSNPLDANQLYHVATVAATNPAYRVIAFANPSGAPFSYKQQNLTFFKRLFISTLRNLRPLVSAELSYLEQENIMAAHHIGYSYGAHKALIEVLYSNPEHVQSLILIDPVAHPRGMKQLIEDFQNTFAPMAGYVNRTKIQTYFDARNEAARTEHHKAALKRPINIAIGFMIMRLDFISFVKKLLSGKPNLHISVAWGTESELGNDEHVSSNLQQLAQRYPGRVESLRLEGDRHALANDIHLYAAIIHESLRRKCLQNNF